MTQSYYDILHVAPDASVAQIEAAYEAQYNESRRKVIHHDPVVAEEANRTLRTLDDIHLTLTDPGKRVAYDASIGLGGAVGGLADPEMMRAAGPRPVMQPARVATARQPEVAGRLDAWECPACGRANPIETRFCSQCGQTIGRNCPSCGRLIRESMPFCNHCGTEVAEKEREQELEKQQQMALQRREAERQAILEPLRRQSESAWNWTKAGCMLGVIIAIWAAPIWLVSIVKAQGVLRASQVQGDESYRAVAKKAFWWAIAGIVIGGAWQLLWLILAIS